ncbi:MAG: amidase [Pseudomonadota bacterium]
MHFDSIQQISEHLRNGETTSLALTEHLLERIARFDDDLNAYITVTTDTAIQAAEAADAERAAGRDRGPLHGIPIAIKDLCATAGIRTTAGSKLYEHWIPDADATVVHRLREAGAVLLGKTGMHELAYGMTSDNALFGTIRNPWDNTRTPGGSSGGSAAAVAAGLAYGAIGTDTGCSIRQPAHCCGIVGFKPTFGVVSKAGVVPLCWSMDHVGPMTRTVKDAALMFAAIAGYDSADPWSVALSNDVNLDDLEPASLNGMRLGVVRRHFFEGSPEVVRIVDQAINELVALGSTVVPLDIPDIDFAYTACRRVFLEAAALHAEDLIATPEAFSDAVRPKLVAAGRISGEDYARDQNYRHSFRVRMDALLDECDVLVTPTACVPTPKIDAIGDEYFRLSPCNTNISDFTGQPSISVPCGYDDNGMPIGMMLTGRRLDDWRLLSQAEVVESALGESGHPPRYSTDA